MPIYQYECNKCKNRFELLRNINEKDKDIECPKCKAKNPRKIISPFSMGDGCGSNTNKSFG
ncbi:MAG: zinc ribbon domain-containing protein [Chloroflexi bacterium]|nr:zinc ribbon domain-containing protein [Chloroflexota bacterium]